MVQPLLAVAPESIDCHPDNVIGICILVEDRRQFFQLAIAQ
jgi:hypothetical protein